MKIDLFAHPGSFATRAVEQAERLAAAGVDRLRLAYTYHSGRWLLTTSSAGAVLDLEAGRWFAAEALDDAPAPVPPLVADLAPAAGRALVAAGVAVTAWLVGTHGTVLATRHPELALRNAFGHRYRHALCPAQPAVVASAARLVAAAIADSAVTGLELEAFSFLGWAHDGAHDKHGAQLRPVDRWLLSICLCPACGQRLTAADVDVDALGARIRAAVSAQLVNGRPSVRPLAEDVDSVLGAAVHHQVLAVRSAAVRDLAAAAVAAAAGTPVSIRATTDAYHCGGKAAADLAGLAALGGLTVSSYDGDLTALAHDVATARTHTTDVVAAWNMSAAHSPHEHSLRRALDVAAGHGAHTLALYAYDLAPPDRLTWLGRLAHPRAAHHAEPTGPDLRQRGAVRSEAAMPA